MCLYVRPKQCDVCFSVSDVGGWSPTHSGGVRRPWWRPVTTLLVGNDTGSCRSGEAMFYIWYDNSTRTGLKRDFTDVSALYRPTIYRSLSRLRFIFIIIVINAVVTCEIKLFWNNFEIISVFYFTCNNPISRVTPSEIISKLFQQRLKLFQKYFSGFLQLVNIFQHVQCRRNYFEIISELFQRLK